MCMCLCVFAYEHSMQAKKPEEGIVFFRAANRGDCELPNMGAEAEAWLFCKDNEHS